MKTLHSNLSISVLTILLAGWSLSACAQSRMSVLKTGGARAAVAPALVPVDSSTIKLLMPLQLAATKIKRLVATGDPDYDYAFQAKIHAQGMADFLKQEVKAGKDSALLQMAQTMEADASSDATMLDATIRQIRPTRPNQMFTQEQGKTVDALNQSLQKAATGDSMTGDVDKNFAMLLASQRQTGVDLATNFLKYGRNETLRTYAQQLIDKSNKEMEQLKAMDKKN